MFQKFYPLTNKKSFKFLCIKPCVHFAILLIFIYTYVRAISINFYFNIFTNIFTNISSIFNSKRF